MSSTCECPLSPLPYLTVSVCPLIVATQDAPSHILMVSSPDPDTIRPDTGSTTTHSTGPSWPSSTAVHLLPRHTRTVLHTRKKTAEITQGHEVNDV